MAQWQGMIPLKYEHSHYTKHFTEMTIYPINLKKKDAEM